MMLVRSGDLNREVVVSVSTMSGTAIGMTECGIIICARPYYTPSDLVHVINTYLHLHTCILAYY